MCAYAYHIYHALYMHACMHAIHTFVAYEFLVRIVKNVAFVLVHPPEACCGRSVQQKKLTICTTHSGRRRKHDAQC